MNILKKLMWPIIIAVIALITLVSCYGYVNNTRNEVIAKEKTLVAQYQNNQNELSNYVLTIQEQLGVAAKGNEKLHDVLVDAIQGRYDGNMEPGTSGSMFSAITEAYPDLTATTESYAKIQDSVVSGREAFKNQQTLLLDKIRDYETYLQSNLFRSFFIKNFIGAPTDGLEISVGDDIYTGKEALAKMKKLVLATEAVDSYETGTTSPLITDDTVTNE